MKRFKPMMCPVCGNFYFSEPLEDFKEAELEEYLSGNVQCLKCGWIYDLDQAENPDSRDGFNEMSLTEYKEWYQTKIKENPDYDYQEENMPNPVPHKCPVCGEYEFKNIDSHDICPVCGWEDEDYFDGGGANEMSLKEAKKDFANKRANDPLYKWYKNK